MTIAVNRILSGINEIHPEEFEEIEDKRLKAMLTGEVSIQFYLMRRPSILLGARQKPLAEAPMPQIKRLTPGAAVYFSHRQISFTLLIHTNSIECGGRYREVYCFIDSMILEALRRCGFSASLEKIGDSPKEYRSQECFKDTGKCEIISHEGHKLAGTAFRVLSGVYVHQCLINADDSHRLLSKVTGEPAAEEVATLEEIAGQKIDTFEVSVRLLRELERMIRGDR